MHDATRTDEASVDARRRERAANNSHRSSRAVYEDGVVFARDGTNASGPTFTRRPSRFAFCRPRREGEGLRETHEPRGVGPREFPSVGRKTTRWPRTGTGRNREDRRLVARAPASRRSTPSTRAVLPEGLPRPRSRPSRATRETFRAVLGDVLRAGPHHRGDRPARKGTSTSPPRECARPPASVPPTPRPPCARRSARPGRAASPPSSRHRASPVAPSPPRCSAVDPRAPASRRPPPPEPPPSPSGPDARSAARATVAAVVSCPATIISVRVRLTSSRVSGAPDAGSRAVSNAVSARAGEPTLLDPRDEAIAASARASKCERSCERYLSRRIASGVSNFWYSWRKSLRSSWLARLKIAKRSRMTAVGPSITAAGCAEQRLRVDRRKRG